MEAHCTSTGINPVLQPFLSTELKHFTMNLGPISQASNWAVFTFCASSFAAYQYCLTNRQLEREGMKRAVEVMERKRGDERRKAVGKVSSGNANGQ